jgi:hypothetical protein
VFAPAAPTVEMDAETLAWILASGLATGVGGFSLLLLPRPGPVLPLFPRPGPVVLDVLLGFTAAIMPAGSVLMMTLQHALG